MGQKKHQSSGKMGASRSSLLPGSPVRATEPLLAQAIAHQQAGRLPEAEALYGAILETNPNHAESLNGLGIIAHLTGHPDDAVALIGRAIAIRERNPQFHYNIALVFAALGRLEEAIAHNRRAVRLRPDFADAHTNLAAALTLQGHAQEAALHFRRALAHRPQSPLAYNNLAVTLIAGGKPDEALDVVVRGLAVTPTAELKESFVNCARDLKAVPKGSGLAVLLERAFAEGWGRPSELATFATAVIERDPAIAACRERLDHWVATRTMAEPAALPALAGIVDHRLLRCLLESTPVCDVALERLLTKLRRAMLLAAVANLAAVADELMGFACALAAQCFINEYVFAETDEEQELARRLRDAVASGLSSAASDVSPFAVAVVGAYFPLHAMDVPPAAFERPWPNALRRLLVRQVDEPAEERRLGIEIPALASIDDSVSRDVRSQYEANPYPRWVGVSSLQKRATFDQHLAMQFPRAPFRPLGMTEFDVLIAGCGTGRHAIETARSFAGGRILAVDLSVASLAYAVRKSRELEIPNIAYAQADILELGSIGRSFDIIEAVGVLHHLRDPLQGWRVLLSLLRPNGFMRLGLYSALARQSIRAARAFIAENGYAHDAAGVRKCRQDILGLPDGAAAKAVATSADFFTTSECRDLLFHVQEHHTTIPEIKALLAVNDLAFIGFEGLMRGKYATHFPDDGAATNLDHWHEFETEHPTTFGAMYHFWIQKSGEARPIAGPAPCVHFC
jgi:SAM-dependent methyltransferase/Tfp pilus assembly protein PilF